LVQIGEQMQQPAERERALIVGHTALHSVWCALQRLHEFRSASGCPGDQVVDGGGFGGAASAGRRYVGRLMKCQDPW
jgi:hypothetical protein